jgi:hypothetical protein
MIIGVVASQSLNIVVAHGVESLRCFIMFKPQLTSQLHSAVILPEVIGLEQRCVDSTVQLAAGMSFA